MVNFNCSKTFFILFFTGCFCHGILQAQVLNSETIVRIDQGKKVSTYRLLIQVNNKEDQSLSKIQIRHEPDEELDLLEARIIGPNGNTVRKVKKKDIITRSDLSYGTYYTDGLVTEFDMYWNQYPYQIEYSYEITNSEFFWLAYWYPVEYMNKKSIKSSLRIEFPVNYKISMDYSKELIFNDSIQGKTRILTWMSGPYKPPKPEMFSPPMAEQMPHVFVTPKVFEYGVPGSSESWSSFGAWQMELNRGTDLLPASEKKTVKQLVIDEKDPIEKTRILYNYLQDKTQYINVDIDKGGMKSYPASYVSQNKYGDCKALTTYMKAMLKSIGIESYYTLINGAVNPILVNSDFPSQQFNHAVLMVPIEKDTIWLENTSNTAPFNYLGTFTQGRSALVIDAESSRLVQTPVLKPEDVFDSRNYQFTADEKGNWTVSFNGEIGGGLYENYRYYLKNVSSKDLENSLKEDFGDTHFELEDWKFSGMDPYGRRMKISAQGNSRSQIKKIGSLRVISPKRTPIPDFEKPEKRKSNVRINYPIYRTSTFSYDFSGLNNVRTVQVQDEASISSQYGLYKVTYELQGRNIKVTETFLLESGEYPKSEYKDFYSFIQEIKSLQKSINILIQ